MMMMSCLAVFAAGVFNFIAVDGAAPKGDGSDCDTAAFVKTLKIDAKVARATWTVSGLGVFRAYVNGREVGAEDFLKPGFTHIAKRRHSFSYDVTGFFREGDNSLAAEVSTGWWRDAIVRSVGKAKERVHSAFGGELTLEFADGTRRVVATDSSWRAAYHSRVTHAGIYWGELFDARVDDSWKKTGQDAWPFAVKSELFKGEVTPVEGRTIRVRNDLALKPVDLYVWKGAENAKGTNEFGRACILRRCRDGEPMKLLPGETLVADFGQNAAGVPWVRASGARGAMLNGIGGEMLNDSNGEVLRGNDGPAKSVYTANYRAIRPRASYVFAGEGVEEYRPSFTFYGARYWSFTATEEVKIERLAFLPVMSIAAEDETGTIETGNESVNRLISNCVWGMRSNYLSVPTDCPQRDERFGWSGDTQAFVGAAVYAADVYGFLSKWMTDMRDSQLGPDEPYPDSFRAVAPPGNAGVRGNLLGWADAGVIVPYTLWRQTGDPAVIRANYAAMKKFAAFIESTSWRTPFNYKQCADWLSPDRYECWRRGWGSRFADHPFWDGETEADHRQYWDLLGAMYLVWDMKMMRAMAEAVDAKADIRHFAAAEEKAKKYFRDFFLDHNGDLAERYRTMQTPLVYMLRLGLAPDKDSAARVACDLVASVKKGGYRVGTGFMGTPHVLDALTDECGDSATAYSMLLNRNCPGWLYSVDQGATTIWERWNGYTKEKGFGPIAMNSFNHYAAGSVMGWMYRSMAGIRPGEKGGYSRFTLAPHPDRRVGHCKASYRSRQGRIESEWRYDDRGVCSWRFVVPKGTRAEVRLPGTEVREYAAGEYRLEIPSCGL